jgi:DNA ligase-associated metallophosphoesterase
MLLFSLLINYCKLSAFNRQKPISVHLHDMPQTSTNQISLNIANESFLLLPQKALIRTNDKTLIIADLHLGKATHFRKAGIPVSDEVFKTDLNKIDLLVNQHQIENVWVLGDFFHSNSNSEWARFQLWLETSSIKKWTIIPGNHDKSTLSESISNKMEIAESHILLNGIIYCHEFQENEMPVISGHIHPGISLKGNGKQNLQIPCFFMHGLNLLLPAFGSFTGLAKIEPQKGDRVFGIANESILEIQLTKK